MNPLWTASDLVTATSGEKLGDWDGVTGVSIDTRSLEPGELFVALKGDNNDGHAFVQDALAKGAGAAMVSGPADASSPDLRLLVVKDTFKALQNLGRAARERTKAKVIAVTGSVGKTSTKDMLHLMLADQGSTHAAVKSFNNHLGVPLTLARMPVDTEFAVIEIGMNHMGEIRPLSKMARPDVVIITTVEAVHLEHFETVEEIAHAKAEIFAGLAKDGTAILNIDNAHFDLLASQCFSRIVSFGTVDGSHGDLTLHKAEIREETTVICADLHGKPVTFKIAALGQHFALNAVAALGAVEASGGDLARAALSLAGWHPPGGRGRKEEIQLGPDGMDGQITLLDESYNANPASMQAAFGVLGAFKTTQGPGPVAHRGRRIAFLGDMLELGPNQRLYHAELAKLSELDGVDLVHCCGPLMKALHDALPREKRGIWAEGSIGLAEKARRRVNAGDVCMVKGSLGSGMARVVDAIRSLGTPEKTEET